MAWLEITIPTTAQSIGAVTTALTAGGFSDLLIEDQSEFETFLDENREYWDYIDETLQQKLEGLSNIKLYLEDNDTAGMDKLTRLLEKQNLTMTVSALPEVDYEESWRKTIRPSPSARSYWCCPIGCPTPTLTAACR